jgi:hypothetical protein
MRVALASSKAARMRVVGTGSRRCTDNGHRRWRKVATNRSDPGQRPRDQRLELSAGRLDSAEPRRCLAGAPHSSALETWTGELSDETEPRGRQVVTTRPQAETRIRHVHHSRKPKRTDNRELGRNSHRSPALGRLERALHRSRPRGRQHRQSRPGREGPWRADDPDHGRRGRERSSRPDLQGDQRHLARTDGDCTAHRRMPGHTRTCEPPSRRRAAGS